MKNFSLLFLLVLIISNLQSFPQENPRIDFQSLLEISEEDYSNVIEARKLAAMQNIPHTIYTKEGVFIEARAIEDGKIVYAVYQNIVNVFEGGTTAYWEQISSQFDLTHARQHFANGVTVNPNVGYPTQQISGGTNPELAASFLMIPESTNDRVMSFNAATGDLINADFIPADPTNLATPICAILTPGITVFVSDQLNDQIVTYDTLGNFLGIWVGGIQDTLDNMRGIKIAPDLNSLLATVASGANSDAIAQFNPSGIYVGNFIEPNAAVMDSPWEIVFRTSDILISAGTSDNIARYDLGGTYLDDFVTGLNFPEQIKELTNGNVIAAGFSTPSGLYIYDSNGAQLNYFDAVTGLRGCYPLLNGNYLVTSGTGVHELDGTTGALLRTVVAGVSARFIDPFDVDAVIPVELISFTASVINNSVELRWNTSSEINNSGFEIERSTDNINFEKIGFVPGFGTTTEPKSYSHRDNNVNSGLYYYRLKQIDLDGSYTYSDVVDAEVELPVIFSLEQNYPNPFNPTTTIQFSIPEDSKVSINIYNLLGEWISEVVSNNFNAGTHKIAFNAQDLTSGLYFYKIIATNSSGKILSDVRKMTLLK